MERVTGEVTVHNVHGLHARPAAVFVQIANKFDSHISLEKDGEKVDGKSIIAILSLGVNRGSSVRLVAEGKDSSQAFLELKQFLENDDD